MFTPAGLNPVGPPTRSYQVMKRIISRKATKPYLAAPPGALEILRTLQSSGEFVFPSYKRVNPISKSTMLKLLALMGRSDLTTYGFRSTFRDWGCGTNFVSGRSC